MKFSDVSNSKYLAKGDVPGDGLVLVIDRCEFVQLDDGRKVVMHFMDKTVKPMIVNKTNRSRLTAIFGTDDSTRMRGQAINVWHDPSVEMGGELVGGLRIRAYQPPTPHAQGYPTAPHGLTPTNVYSPQPAAPGNAVSNFVAGGANPPDVDPFDQTPF